MKGDEDSTSEGKSADKNSGSNWTSVATKKKPPRTKKQLKPPRTLEEIINGRPRVLIVLRGLPGSGKVGSRLFRFLVFAETRQSTLVSSLEGGLVCSADDFFINEAGKYMYDVKKIQQAHEWCQKRAVRMLEEGLSPVIVDNTNTMCWEARPYVATALANNYEVEILQPQTDWAFEPEELARKNRHGVPEAAIRKMLQRWEEDFTVERIMRSGGSKQQQAPPKAAVAAVAAIAVAKTIEVDNGVEKPDEATAVAVGIASLSI